MWATIKAACLYSITMAWSYVLGLVSVLILNIDTVAAAFGDPNLKQSFADAVHADPRALGYFGITVSVVNCIARMRSIVSPKA